MIENYRKPIASIEKLPRFTTMNVIDGQAGLAIYASLIFYSLTIDNILNIIVLLILAGVAISMLSGENGILKQAAKAKTKTEEAQKKEQVQLAQLEAASNLEGTTHTETLTDLKAGHQEVSVKIPAGFTISPREGEQNIETGLVIIDSDGNEYVWIPVFTSEQIDWGAVYPDTLPSKTAKESEFTDDHVNVIKTALRGKEDDGYTTGYTATYYKDYATNYSDVWYGDSNYGQYGYYDGSKFVYYTNGNMDEPTYNKLYRDMLISVYKNGGFYIGRYEMGTAVVNSVEEAQSNTRTKVSEYTPSDATSGTNINTGAAVKIGTKPVIKANAVPYNYITQSQAQMLAESLNYSSVKSSLMFGVQWDMVCVFLEHYGKVDSSAKTNAGTQFDANYLKSNDYSKYWGNYSNSAFNMNQGFYNIYNSGFQGWTVAAEKTSTSEIWLCTTGASNQNSSLNIYDFAGNEYEWTLERYSSSYDPCVIRGGLFYDGYASHRGNDFTYGAFYSFSARPSLYIK